MVGVPVFISQNMFLAKEETQPESRLHDIYMLTIVHTRDFIRRLGCCILIPKILKAFSKNDFRLLSMRLRNNMASRRLLL